MVIGGPLDFASPGAAGYPFRRSSLDFFGSPFVVFSDLCAGGGIRCFPVTDLGWPVDFVTAGECCGSFPVASDFSGDWNLPKSLF